MRALQNEYKAREAETKGKGARWQLNHFHHLSTAARRMCWLAYVGMWGAHIKKYCAS